MGPFALCTKWQDCHDTNHLKLHVGQMLLPEGQKEALDPRLLQLFPTTAVLMFLRALKKKRGGVSVRLLPNIPSNFLSQFPNGTKPAIP